MRGRKVLWAILLAVAMLVPASSALAYEGAPPDGQVIFGGDFTLDAGETLDGDLVVFGGSATLEEDSQVEGNVVIWGGNVEAAGIVDGDLVVIGGNVDLLDTAVVDGDAVTIGGSMDWAEGAEVRGQHITGPGEPWQWEWGWAPPVVVPSRWTSGLTAGRLIVRAVRPLVLAVVMAALAGLAVVIWPQPSARAGRTAVRSLLPSLGVGLLTVVVVVGLLISICLTVIGLPAGLAAGLAAIYGWLALGIVIGERLMSALTSRQVSPFWSAALGAGLLTLLSGLLDLIPCVGWVVLFQLQDLW